MYSTDVYICLVTSPAVTVETTWHVPARGRLLAPSSSALHHSGSI